MSLHQIANHVQSAGRGDDKILVHMTPGEVNGLQAIAMAHGGSLTINPQTGLPEAGFLKAILPMVAGFALGPAGLGIAKTAIGAGAMVGGATALATGSLSKGLMAGFGAYGGFGIGEGLAAAGASAMGNAGANAAAGVADDAVAAKLGSASKMANTSSAYQGAGAANTGASAATKAVESGGLPGYSGLKLPAGASYSPSIGATPTPYGTINTAAGEGMRLTPGDLINAPKGTYGLQPEKFTNAELNRAMAGNDMSRTLSSSQAPGRGYGLDIPSAQYPVVATQNPLTQTSVVSPSYMDKVGAGFRDVTSSGDKAWNFVKEHPAPFITAGVGLASDLMGNKSKTGALASSPSYLRPYEFSTEQDPNAYLDNDSTAERRYFKEPRYTALPIQQVASGGLLGMAVGGPVEEMSAANAVGENMMYPQSQLKTDTYSNPMMQRPMPTNVIHSGIDAPVGAYSGEQRMASGGLAHYAFGGSAAAKKAEPTTDTKYSYNPETMQYTQTTTAAPAAKGIQTGNPFIDGMVGLFGNVGPYGIAPNMTIAGSGARLMGSGLGGGFMNPKLAAFYGGQQTPQPTTTTETSGGMLPPAGQQQAQPQMQAANPIVPNINVPEYQTPEQQLGLEGFYDMMDAQLAKKGAQLQGMANGGMAGNSHLGGYSDGGRLLRGPGDGVSDSIPAVIGRRQPARLADGEFVVPARIVSEIGNGSTEAGARKLYAMMDRVQKARKKSVGKGKVAVNSKSERFLPA